MSASIVIPAELSIRMFHPGFVAYQGTRAMLEAEGIIPANTKWPDGYDSLWWTDGVYRYRVTRQRPDGAKGPRKLFMDVDWWCLCQDLAAGDYLTRELDRKKQELADYAHRNSAKGRKESARRFDSYMAACADEKFQIFKSLIPGLIKPKRERRPKSGHQHQGAAA